MRCATFIEIVESYYELRDCKFTYTKSVQEPRVAMHRFNKDPASGTAGPVCPHRAWTRLRHAFCPPASGTGRTRFFIPYQTPFSLFSPVFFFTYRRQPQRDRRWVCGTLPSDQACLKPQRGAPLLYLNSPGSQVQPWHRDTFRSKRATQPAPMSWDVCFII